MNVSIFRRGQLILTTEPSQLLLKADTWCGIHAALFSTCHSCLPLLSMANPTLFRSPHATTSPSDQE